MGVWSVDYIPRGVRFGPLLGEVMSPSGGRAVKTIVVEDDSRCNWMKFVNVAVTNETQNLVACQMEKDIYFYSIRSIKPNSELT
ncbi:unnamed protein product, partial [Nippostrongylus brasiliensis]|uniref:SET domain-containing protein n=1 Tax=Nippostrongylus brasiliensis TaxID=27835 RepID=A0A0N4YXH1_NIPBR